MAHPFCFMFLLGLPAGASFLLFAGEDRRDLTRWILDSNDLFIIV